MIMNDSVSVNPIELLRIELLNIRWLQFLELDIGFPEVRDDDFVDGIGIGCVSSGGNIGSNDPKPFHHEISKQDEKAVLFLVGDGDLRKAAEEKVKDRHNRDLRRFIQILDEAIGGHD